MSTVPQEFQGGGNPNSSVTQSGADSTPPAQLFGDEDLFSVFQLYPAITEGKFYRTDNKLLKHTIERYTADIAGPEIETTLGRDGLPMPGALPVDATKLLPVLVPPAPFEVCLCCTTSVSILPFMQKESVLSYLKDLPFAILVQLSLAAFRSAPWKSSSWNLSSHHSNICSPSSLTSPL